MSGLLKLLIIYIFFAFFLIGIFFSKIKVCVKQLDLQIIEKRVQKKYRISIGLYLYGILKIWWITLEEDGIKIFGKKIKYQNLKQMEIYEKMKNIEIKEFDKKTNLKFLKALKIELERLDLKLDLGFESVLLTSFAIFIISTILSMFVKDTVKKYNPEKYKYTIMPHYRSMNQITLKAKSIIAIKTVHIMYMLLNYKKRRVKRYERTSYRRSYENSYE